MPITITKVVQPDRGAIMMFYCSQCKSTVILVNEHAIKPERGDLWRIQMCADILRHNMPMLEPKFNFGGVCEEFPHFPQDIPSRIKLTFL